MKLQKKTIIGPTLPTFDDLMKTNSKNNKKYNNDNNDNNNDNHESDNENDTSDLIGPAQMTIGTNNNNDNNKRLLQMEHTKIIAEMKTELKMNDENENNKREEWMTSMPYAFDNNDFMKGTTQRRFKMTQHVNDETWTQNPNEKINKKIVEHKTNQKLKEMGLPSIYERNNNNDDDNKDSLSNDDNNDNYNRQTLFEKHQIKLENEYNEKLQKWKKEKKRRHKRW